jgi:hypothetical protein
MKALPACALTLLVAAGSAAPLRADGDWPTVPACNPPRLQFTVGERNWISFGDSSSSFANFGRHPNVLSELKWINLQTTVNEFNFDAVLDNRFVAHTDIGLGWFYGGRLRDHDYFGENRTKLFSLSDSPMDTGGVGVVDLTCDFGYRVIRRDTFTLDALVGYQYWREKYHAVGGTLFLPSLKPYHPLDFPRVPTDAEIYTRDCFRVGGRASWQLLPRLSWDTRLMFVPWAYSEVTDFHFQRTDFASPAQRSRTQGGFGFMLDSVLTYRVWRGLSLVVGYQAWDITSGQGSTSEFFQDGSQLNLHLNEIQTFRHGALIGAEYRF